MKTVKIVNASDKEKELLKIVSFKEPVFIEYVDTRSEAKRIKSYYGSRTNPFVVIIEDKFETPFYSEIDNAINQLINYLNGRD